MVLLTLQKVQPNMVISSGTHAQKPIIDDDQMTIPRVSKCISLDKTMEQEDKISGHFEFYSYVF